ncbi:MAG: hypothetical protein H7177_08340 [Rhizobacter sp.]|nr:hypothetical protein [Bacteriovorax sp.]
MKKHLPLSLFLLTRIFAIFFMAAILSDTIYYSFLAQKMFTGAVPYIDFPFEYPPFAIFPIYLPGVISTESYRLWFMLLAFTFDFAVFWQIKKQGHELLLYVVLSSLLLPFSLERLDIFMVLPIVMSIIAYQKQEFTKGAVYSTIGGWLKLIPFITYIGMWNNKKDFSRSLVKAFILNCIILTICSISFYSNMFDFLKYHLNRPFQVESVMSSIVMGFSKIFSIPFSIVNSFGSQNILFNYNEIFLKLFSILLFVSFGYLLVFYYKNKSRVNLFDMMTTLLLTLMVFSKVLSDQYFLWPVALIFLGHSITQMNRLDKTILGFIYLSTCLIFVNYWDFIAGKDFWQTLLFFKNLGLIFILWRSFKLLKDQTATHSIKT